MLTKKRKRDKKVNKQGFNLIKAFPITFSEKIEPVRYDGAAEIFNIPLPDTKVEHIIINLCSTEPWTLPNSIAIGNSAQELFSQLNSIRTQLFDGPRCHVVISTHERYLRREIEAFKGYGDWMHPYLRDPIYPHDNPVLLLNDILGLDLPFGQDSVEIGVLILDAQTVTGMFKSHIEGDKHSTRLIPISGTGLVENKILKVTPGTPLRVMLEGNVKEDIDYRTFLDGPLNGYEITDFSQGLNWSTKSIVVLEEKDYKTLFPFMQLNKLLFTTNLMGELRRCVYCNYCDDICPVGLEPALFWHCHTRGEKERARLYRLEKCIECGLCSFICPSKLELLQVIKECKS
jgi:Na+-translocating ferredoxin:NAD+ oxidoreductase RnfC subunit